MAAMSVVNMSFEGISCSTDSRMVPSTPSAVDSPSHSSLTAAGQYPSLKDWETHLTTIFPEVRLKRYMEMRGADGGSRSAICALPALWVGLLYDR